MTGMPFEPGDNGPEWGYDGAAVEARLERFLQRYLTDERA